MKKYLSIIFIFILALSALGCIEQPEPPGAGYPRVVIDYDEKESETNETIIHLRGMEIIKYEDVNLYIDGEPIIEDYEGYSIEYRTDLTEFDMRVEASRDETRYQFNATIEVRPEVEDEDDENDLIFRITYDEEEQDLIYMDDLPYIELLEEMEDQSI